MTSKSGSNSKLSIQGTTVSKTEVENSKGGRHHLQDTVLQRFIHPSVVQAYVGWTQ